MAAKKKYQCLPWEYCECGCKSYTVSLGSQFYSLHWDTKETWNLFSGHRGNLVSLGTFSSQEAADRETRRLAGPALRDEFTKLKADAKLLGLTA